MRCTLDFLSRTEKGEYKVGADGNLMAEYLLASKIAQEIKEAQSNDPFTCRLYSSGGTGARSSLRLAGSGEVSKLVCLDIAAASLPGVEPLVNYAPAPRDGDADGGLGAKAASNASAAFGGGVTCHGNSYGDGTINAYDVVAFLWAQFGNAPHASVAKREESQPLGLGGASAGQRSQLHASHLNTVFACRYDALPPPTDGPGPLAAVETVVPRTGTANGCTSALDAAVSLPSNKTGWVAVAGGLVASTSTARAGASSPQLLTRAEYLLMLSSDYCFTETNHSHSRRLETSDAAAAAAEAVAFAAPAGLTTAAGLAAAGTVEARSGRRRVLEADGGGRGVGDAAVEVSEAEDPDGALRRRLAQDQDGEDLAEEAYRAELAAALLSCADTACIRDALVRSLPPSLPPLLPRGAFGALTAARPWELVSTQDQILVQRWAAVEGLGQWFRLVLPRTALVAEIYLLNAPPLSGQLDPGQPPEADCIADECAPLAEAKRGTVLVGFYRRLDLLEAAGRVDANGEADAGGCASIETISHLAADTISVRQDPPAAGCPFDLFVWVPEALRDGYVGRECDGVFGVATGSSVNDGRTGVVQRSGACAAPPTSPPSSPPSPPPAKAPPLPPPPAEPTLESKASGILRELAFGDVSGYGGLALVVLAALLCCCCCLAVLMCRQRTRKRRRKRSELRRNSLVTLAVGSATEPVPPPNTATWL